MTLREFKDCYKMAKKIGMSLSAYLSIRARLIDHDKESRERELKGETHDAE